MEAILDELDHESTVSMDEAIGAPWSYSSSTSQDDNHGSLQLQATALQALAVALGNVQRLLSELPTTTTAGTPAAAAAAAAAASSSLSPQTPTDSTTTPEWLHSLLSQVPSELGTEYLVQQVWDIATQYQSALDPSGAAAQQQDALLNVLGFTEAALATLAELLPRMTDISKLSQSSLHLHKDSDDNLIVDVQEERRQYLLNEAQQASELAAIAQAEADAATFGSSSARNAATHTVGLSSTKELQKQAEKAQKRAQQAWQRAKEAGAVVDDDQGHHFRVTDTSPLGPGGLMATSTQDLQMLQQSLLPEGSREYYDNRGLPKGTIRESHEDYEMVLIPPQERDESQLHPRLELDDLLTPQERLAFQGTASLNPMQSTVFEKAFHSRDNLMVCAPTGAGKTNVALLTVVAHFRDVGKIGGQRDKNNSMETGAKVVYIAPMKALAQEVVEKFSSKLKALNLIVRELTGDMQLTRAEAESADVLVTTPEKWDVVTRKSGGGDENALGNQCGLLIIDEVHLLADDRGAVIESVVARLHRNVERRQRQTRIVALSATLPNYQDVAKFLQAPEQGTFFFGPEHRPVPLIQTFLGVNTPGTRDPRVKEQKMNQICFDAVLDSLKRGYQVMVFVHSRKGTADTANALAEMAAEKGVLDRHFRVRHNLEEEDRSDGNNKNDNDKRNKLLQQYSRYADRVQKNTRNAQMKQLFDQGMGIHHAGMLRNDRKLTEQMFHDGAIKVLCCTATLAWGINLPAHTVIIKGTDVYNPEKGGVVDLSILDVQQIFGRAGRPQFDTSGEATLITTAEAFPKYLDKLVRAVPIESNFIQQLPDHLNAEIVGGTVTTIAEGATWLTYTYLYTRMMRNPLAYGISHDAKTDDSSLIGHCTKLITEAAKQLEQNQMIRYHADSGNLSMTHKGKVAAHYYIQTESIATFNDMLKSQQQKFRNMKVRQEELSELASLHARECPIKLQGVGLADDGHSLVTGPVDKAFILAQIFISRSSSKIKSFTLISDMNYVAANAGRISRSLFELCIKDGQAAAALKLLRLAKSVDNQIWWFQTPLRHFQGEELKEQQLSSIELHFNNTRKSGRAADGLTAALSLLDLHPSEVGQIAKLNQKGGGEKLQRLIGLIPNLEVTCKVQPVTTQVLNFHLTIVPSFEWVRRWHGGAQSFWLWIEDGSTNRLYHHETIIFSQRRHNASFDDPIVLDLPIPVFDRVPSQYLVRAVSDSWVGAEYLLPVSLDKIVLPSHKRPETDLQDLTPLPITALQDARFEALYASKFDTFNPIQTQLFHVLYHTDTPVFLGAPTGSGKTIVSELAILRMKRLYPKDGICVYIAPLKSLARERLKEWQAKFGQESMGWKVLELSGDTHHDRAVLEKADILICTPEKWDLITRGWKGTPDVAQGSNASNGKAFVKRVRLLVMDEVHLVGEDRGAVLEAIVSRTRYISRLLHEEGGKTSASLSKGVPGEFVRLIGLSTPLENPLDLADWIGIDTKSHSMKSLRGMYNFRSSVRPVPTRVHVQGYPGKHYCPRMATMNKPCYAAIKEHSPSKPALIFVASRRQTRLTAFDIISNAASDETPKRFLGCPEEYIDSIAARIQDEALRHTIAFGVGLHHAGLSAHDRDIVERLYLKGDINVLVATATLAWGVNLPARLVIVKGTEYFDGKVSRYVDYPLTDLLQMIGRAGRPGFDDRGVAVVMCVDDKKQFLTNFLYKPFPLESRLAERLRENINAEIAGGTISSLTEAIGYLSWTFYGRRVRGNPSYYGLESASDDHVEAHFAQTIKDTLKQLEAQGCIENKDDEQLVPTALGLACSNYYLDHRTPKQMLFGIREARQIISSFVKKESLAVDLSAENSFAPLIRGELVENISCAWLLYTLCSTHEFDELPVRHNEEHLNEELSDGVMWGPDTQQLLSSGGKVYRDPDIFADPHTKTFLLVQAYLEDATLPISDYVNDTKSVVENVPRLLAAMEFIASGETTEGSFELMTAMILLRQIWTTRTLPTSDPLVQLQLSDKVIHRIRSNGKPGKGWIRSLFDIRSRSKNDVLRPLQQMQGLSTDVLQRTLDLLYNMPLVTVKGVSATKEFETQSGKTIGKLQINLEIERSEKSAKNGEKTPVEHSLTILLGTYHAGMLLARTSIPIARNGAWSLSKEISFDFSTAIVGGATKVIVRLMMNEVRGLDLEASVAIE
ncbi:hypothetical protein ACA910_013398 [Epithemia clementina (nom. ined.)]